MAHPLRCTPVGLLAGALTLLAPACGPTLMDEPTEYLGNDDLSIGVLCSDDEISDDGEYWVKFAVRHVDGVEVDWAGEQLRVQGAAITRRAAGRDTRKNDGTWRRFETYWLVPGPGSQPGSAVSVGPLSLRYGQGPGVSRTLDSARCAATVKK